jgi:hypothetical protein
VNRKLASASFLHFWLAASTYAQSSPLLHWMAVLARGLALDGVHPQVMCESSSNEANIIFCPIGNLIGDGDVYPGLTAHRLHKKKQIGTQQQ